MIIETLEVAGFVPVLEALRLPFKLQPRSIVTPADEQIYMNPILEGISSDYKILVQRGQKIYIDKKDLSLMKSLIKKGDEHAKCIRGIEVYAKIEMPLYFMVEFDTYRIGIETLSTSSSMHTDCKGLQGKELQDAKSKIGGDYIYERVFKVNYQALRRMYKQRCVVKHRLPEWEEFGNWVNSLPLSKELITL